MSTSAGCIALHGLDKHSSSWLFDFAVCVPLWSMERPRLRWLYFFGGGLFDDRWCSGDDYSEEFSDDDEDAAVRNQKALQDGNDVRSASTVASLPPVKLCNPNVVESRWRRLSCRCLCAWHCDAVLGHCFVVRSLRSLVRHLVNSCRCSRKCSDSKPRRTLSIASPTKLK